MASPTEKVTERTTIDQQNDSAYGTADALCAVCGDENAKMHYGVLACLGCKGFFRRALKKVNEYECLRDNNCVIDKHERNSCRFCRLRKCLEVGMDPAAVRPDRDFSGHKLLAHRLSLSGSSSSSSTTTGKTSNRSGGFQHSSNSRREKRKGSMTHAETNAAKTSDESSRNCSQRLPVEMRTMLMTLQNIEAKVVRGDTAMDASEIYPLHINTIREIITDPAKLRGRRTEIRYEPYRMARNEELCVIVYRRLIAAIDWVELLAERMGGLSTEDRIALVKACFGPLTLFKCSARTAIVTENENLLCLCNFAYVPREISKAYSDAYHLDNGLVERLLNELVGPFRRIHLSEEEVVCMSAIIVLNPMARDLSEQASQLCFQLRNRIFATLYQIVKECRAECNPNVWFGNLLLFLPIVTSLANAMCENLRFAQTFSPLGEIPLLTSLFGCFPVESFAELMALGDASKDSGENDDNNKMANNQRKVATEPGTQTGDVDRCIILRDQIGRARKRRIGPTDSLTEDQTGDFRLLEAPCSHTLREMFDDRINEEEEMEQQQQQQQRMNHAMNRKGDELTPATDLITMTKHSAGCRQTASDREGQQVIHVVQHQLQGQQKHVYVVHHQPQQQQQHVHVEQHQPQQQQCYQRVQPPSAQIQQLCLYDGTLRSSNAQPYITGMTARPCPNLITYYPGLDYTDPNSQHQFWHQNPLCASSSQLFWPMTAAPTIVPAQPLMNKGRATVSVRNVMEQNPA